jgi:hypothetical protein
MNQRKHEMVNFQIFTNKVHEALTFSFMQQGIALFLRT